MNAGIDPFLLAAAVANAVAALLHVGCIVFGAPWYRFFGAGERMAQMAAAGDRYPTLVSSFIVCVLSVWALYALSGAGVIGRLPLLRLGLCLITGVYWLRGLVVLPLAATGRATAFWWWSSAICLGIGALHGLGLRAVWDNL